MTISTIRPNRTRRGFTLVEVMIGASIGSFVLLGMLSSYLMLGRSSARLTNYNIMEVESRRAIDEFSQDVRMASNITWNGNTSITLTVPDNYAANANRVTYAYDSSTSGATKTSFYRMPFNSDSTDVASKRVLVRNVSTCLFRRYDRLDATATTDASTKRIELSLKVSVTSQTTATTTENAVSATYLLRNKLAN